MRRDVKVLSLGLGHIAEGAEASGALWRQRQYARFINGYHVVARSYVKPSGVLEGWREDGMSVTPTNSSGRLGYVRDAVAIGSRIIRDEGIQVVCSADPYFTGLAALRLGRKFGLPVEINLLGNAWCNPFASTRLSERILGEIVLRRADAIRVNTEVEGALMGPRFGKPIHVGPAFCDNRAFASVAGDREAARREWTIPADAEVVLAIGRLVRQKRFDHLLQAFDRIRRERPKALLLLVGDGPLRKPLEAEAARLQLGDTVRFLGLVPNDRVTGVLDAADVFMMSSEEEGTCIVLLEAALRRRPIVATAFAGARDLLGPVMPDLVAPVHDPQGLADRALRLLGDRDLCRTAADALFDAVQRDFDSDALAARRADHWHSMVAKTKRN